jgi:hypothetical protein
MDNYYILPGEFESERLIVKPLSKKKYTNHEIEKSDIFYRYPCSTCKSIKERKAEAVKDVEDEFKASLGKNTLPADLVTLEENKTLAAKRVDDNFKCNICDTDCYCGSPTGCPGCINGKINNDTIRELYVFMEDLQFNGGLFFSKNEGMYGNASLSCAFEKNDPYQLSIFGDSALEIGTQDGFLKKLRRAFLQNVRQAAPSKYPKNGTKPKDIEDIVNDKSSIRQDISLPLTEEERSADTTKKGVPTPTKYFKLKYFPKKTILNAEDTALSIEQRKIKSVMIKQMKNGIESRDVPVGTYTWTKIALAVIDEDTKKTTVKDLPSFTSLKGKNLSANMIVKYSSASYSPKMSISEEIVAITIISMQQTEAKSIMNRDEFLKRLKLTPEQSKRNMEELMRTSELDSDQEDDTQTDATTVAPCEIGMQVMAGIPPPP